MDSCNSTHVENVTLVGNILTVSPDFTLPETSQKDIVVKCVCNEIRKRNYYNASYIQLLA